MGLTLSRPFWLDRPTLVTGATGLIESNIAGTWALLEACRRSPTVRQIVVASLDKAYGDHEKPPYNEDAPLRRTIDWYRDFLGAGR